MKGGGNLIKGRLDGGGRPPPPTLDPPLDIGPFRHSSCAWRTCINLYCVTLTITERSHDTGKGPIRKCVCVCVGAIRFRSITKSGGGGGKLCKPGPAPHKRTLTLLGGGSFEPPEPPLATGLSSVSNLSLDLIMVYTYHSAHS